MRYIYLIVLSLICMQLNGQNDSTKTQKARFLQFKKTKRVQPLYSIAFSGNYFIGSNRLSLSTRLPFTPKIIEEFSIENTSKKNSEYFGKYEWKTDKEQNTGIGILLNVIPKHYPKFNIFPGLVYKYGTVSHTETINSQEYNSIASKFRSVHVRSNCRFFIFRDLVFIDAVLDYQLWYKLYNTKKITVPGFEPIRNSTLEFESNYFFLQLGLKLGRYKQIKKTKR